MTLGKKLCVPAASLTDTRRMLFCASKMNWVCLPGPHVSSLPCAITVGAGASGR